MGAVEIYHDDQWVAVCDDGFNGLAARVVCQTLGYKEGMVVLGSAFGETTGPIRVRRIDCGGNEKDLFDCNFEFTDKPVCKKYISVYCSNVQIYNTGKISTKSLNPYLKNYPIITFYIVTTISHSCTCSFDLTFSVMIDKFSMNSLNSFFLIRNCVRHVIYVYCN